MTFRQAAYLVASDEVARAKDWEYALWSNPKVPRPAVYKAKLEVHAAKMRAARLLQAKSFRDLSPMAHLFVLTKMRVAADFEAFDKYLIDNYNETR